MSIEQVTEEIWVNTREGSALTGYSQVYLKILARKISRMPEGERLVRIRNRSNRYEYWLPDLVKYMKEFGNGPQKPPGGFFDDE